MVNPLHAWLLKALPATLSELWWEMETLRKGGVNVDDLPASAIDLDRELKRLEAEGRIGKRHNGCGQVEWVAVVKRKVERVLF